MFSMKILKQIKLFVTTPRKECIYGSMNWKLSLKKLKQLLQVRQNIIIGLSMMGSKKYINKPTETIRTRTKKKRLKQTVSN